MGPQLAVQACPHPPRGAGIGSWKRKSRLLLSVRKSQAGVQNESQNKNIRVDNARLRSTSRGSTGAPLKVFCGRSRVRCAKPLRPCAAPPYTQNAGCGVPRGLQGHLRWDRRLRGGGGPRGVSSRGGGVSVAAAPRHFLALKLPSRPGINHRFFSACGH